MKLTKAQRFALIAPVATAQDMRPGHVHSFTDIHGRLVSLSLTVSRFQSLLFGAPVWDARASLSRNAGPFRLSKRMEPDAYAATVFALMGVGSDEEFYNINPDRKIVSLKIPLTKAEVKVLEEINGRPNLSLDVIPEQKRDRPEDHYKRHAWMDQVKGALFETYGDDEPDEPKESLIIHGD